MPHHLAFHLGLESLPQYPFGEGLMNPKNITFLSLKIDFVIANGADPDEMPRVAFHQGLDCLLKYLFGGSGLQRVNETKKYYISFSED